MISQEEPGWLTGWLMTPDCHRHLAVDDERNTDNAWVETTALLIKANDELLKWMSLDEP